MESGVQKIGLAASVAMPLFNIPMILHIIKRKTSNDISLAWLLGVWSCIVLMFPAAMMSSDIVFRVFGIVNILLFSLVVVVTLRYRKQE